MTWFAIVILALLLLRMGVQLWLERLNQMHVEAHSAEVPPALREIVSPATYAKSVSYTLAKIRFGRVELICDLLALLVVLFSGFLPWSFDLAVNYLGQSAWALAVYLFGIGVVLAVPGLPLAWHSQFRIEQHFGFNTMSPQLWVVDRLKALLLAAALGLPLLALVLKIAEWAGASWWLWAWAVLMAFQLVMMVLAPILILPLFNKLVPLPEGPLRERLLGLGKKTGFHARNILVMDGSKRSRHSNAFFTSLGRWRKIVLFDTLIQQLAEPELEAVLAHEIGHYKKGHIPKLLLVSAAGSLAGFYALAWITQQAWIFAAFGFNPPAIAPALLLFAMLASLVTFWLSPLLNLLSRRFEYQADAYAAHAVGEPHALITSLRKLNEKNLSNLTPHPWYSAFYYSHPTLIEREAALSLSASPRLGEQTGSD